MRDKVSLKMARVIVGESEQEVLQKYSDMANNCKSDTTWDFFQLYRIFFFPKPNGKWYKHYTDENGDWIETPSSREEAVVTAMVQNI